MTLSFIDLPVNDLLPKDETIDNIKTSIENFLTDISKQERELFTHRELEDMLLDIYNLAK